MRLPRSPSGWTIAVFGLLAFVLGGYGLLHPSGLLALLGFEVIEDRESGEYTNIYLAASSMAAVNMGAYYLLAAASDWKPFFTWTVPFRLLTFTVFTTLVLTGAAPAKFIAVGAWEGLGAVATGTTLWLERRAGRRSRDRAV